MIHNVIMPDLGQTAAEGKIVRWLKKPGDSVSMGEPLLEVETDKVTMEVESYKGGYLRAILVAEGEVARALSPIAILTDRPDEACENAPAGDAATAGPLADKLPPLPRADKPGAGSPVSSPVAVANVPELNVRYANGVVEQRTAADLLLVVALDERLSLVGISDPTSLSWEEYAGQMRQTLERAGHGLASPSLPAGIPALAISNLGMFGIRQFRAIIPPGSTAILAIGAVREEAV